MFLRVFLFLFLSNLLAPPLIAAHTANNLDFGDESKNKKEGYESEKELTPCTL